VECQRHDIHPADANRPDTDRCDEHVAWCGIGNLTTRHRIRHRAKMDQRVGPAPPCFPPRRDAAGVVAGNFKQRRIRGLSQTIFISSAAQVSAFFTASKRAGSVFRRGIVRPPLQVVKIDGDHDDYGINLGCAMAGRIGRTAVLAVDRRRSGLIAGRAAVGIGRDARSLPPFQLIDQRLPTGAHNRCNHVIADSRARNACTRDQRIATMHRRPR
jgi:hypothetical protein